MEKYPDDKLGFISSMADSTIRLFYGYGRNNCRVIFPSTPSSTFRRGLLEMRDDVIGENGFSTT